MQSNQSNQSKQNLKKESNEEAYVDLDEIPQPRLTGHTWRQRGTMLICESCPFTHSSFIPPDYQLYGIGKDGIPLIKKLEFPTESPK